MEKKLKIIIEILFVIAALSFYTVKTIIPEYKKQLGSSDRIINPEKCKSIIEVKVNDLDFMLLLDKKNNIYHTLFFENKSIVLYNKNIENNNISTSTEKIIKLLIESDYLKKDSTIIIINYDNNYNSEFTEKFKYNMSKYNLNQSIIEEKSTIMKKAKELKITSTTRNDILLEMDLLSKNIYSAYSDKSKNLINSSNSRTYTDNVYKKLEKNIIKNNITNMDRDNPSIEISLISADSSSNYYPSSNSWYYVKNKKIYAYIEIISNNQKYAYCYKGSIDQINEGECGSNEQS